MEPLLYIPLGIIAGVLAGLFGVGGGLIIVPVLVALYSHLGFNDSIITHLAIGTSLATIIFTSISSVWTPSKTGCPLVSGGQACSRHPVWRIT